MASSFRRQPTARMVTGVRSFDRKLSKFKDSVNNRIIKSGWAAAAREGKKIAKARVPSKLKTVKAAIGSTGAKKNKPAKFGGGVGMKRSGKAATKRAASFQKKRSGSGGVGITNANIHWWILGTRPRRIKRGGKTWPPAGMSTGRMPKHPVIRQAAAAGKGKIKKAFRTAVIKGMAKERKKQKLKGR